MYKGKQQELSVSRTLSFPKRGSVRQFQIADKRKSVYFQNSIMQFEKDGFPTNGTTPNTLTPKTISSTDYVGGISSIVGGLTTGIAGTRDLYNAYNDNKHPTLMLTAPTPLDMLNVTGSLEHITGLTYKAKIQGNLIPTQLPTITYIRNGPPGTKRRIIEGGANSLSGFLNMGAGIASIIPGGAPWAAAMYGLSAVSTGASGLIRWWRSK